MRAAARADCRPPSNGYPPPEPMRARRVSMDMSPSPSARAVAIICISRAHSASTVQPYTGSTALPRRWRPFNKNPSGVAPIRTRTTFSKSPSAHSRAHLPSRHHSARARAQRFACISHAQQAHVRAPTTRGRSPQTVHHRPPGSPIPIATPRTRARCSSDLQSSTQQPWLHRHRPRSPPLVPGPTSTRRPRPWHPGIVQRPRHTHDLHGRTSLDHINPPPLHLNLRERTGHAARHAGTAPRWSKSIPRPDCTHPARRESPRSARVDATVRRVMTGEDECR
ncbi:hypothetical protein DFH08DRAFT_889851 [Mycena albidolilacea]|uniref:Uncharacterized protein n=1 Tax=Mycena albidolilacea TaxID=1033008 RepID=A0AAD7EFQ9_9AGAR|nr:hypothetical protein DFH08DRAFT_889851 [Mycena albidolilacea]